MVLRKKDTYHHGQLRKDLLSVAQAIIKTEGWQKLSLRRIAREAGVSHTAPYHHFPDKVSLLAAIAEDGFNLLIKDLKDKVNAPPEDSNALKKSAITYILFAHRNPQLYRLMFSFDFGGKEKFPNLTIASSNAFSQIVPGMFNIDTNADKAKSEVAMASWSMVHGLSMLLIDHQLDVSLDQEEEIVLLMEKLLDIMWVGIANIRHNI